VFKRLVRLSPARQEAVFPNTSSATMLKNTNRKGKNVQSVITSYGWRSF